MYISEAMEKFKKEELCVNCETKAEAVEFLRYLHNEGYTWLTGEDLTKYTHWENYSSNTCYAVRTAYKQKLAYCSTHDWDEKIIKYKQIKFKGKKIMNNLEINNESFIKDFRSSRIAVRCRTHTEALAFIDFLSNNNIHWRAKDLFGCEEWFDYMDDTCYYFENSHIFYNGVNDFDGDDYTIISFSDLKFIKELEQIIVTRLGSKVVATYQSDVAVAICNPVDDFSFEVGAKLAIQKLHIPEDNIEFKEGRDVYCAFYNPAVDEFCVEVVGFSKLYYFLVIECKCFLKECDAVEKVNELNKELKIFKESLKCK